MILNKIKTEGLKEEDPQIIPAMERRAFLKMGLLITGVFAGGSVLSATSIVEKAFASSREFAETYPYKPHYSMVIHQDRCVDCELCMTACIKTNNVPTYGYRTESSKGMIRRRRRGRGNSSRSFATSATIRLCLGMPYKGDVQEPGQRHRNDGIQEMHRM